MFSEYPKEEFSMTAYPLSSQASQSSFTDNEASNSFGVVGLLAVILHYKGNQEKHHNNLQELFSAKIRQSFQFGVKRVMSLLCNAASKSSHSKYTPHNMWGVDRPQSQFFFIAEDYGGEE